MLRYIVAFFALIIVDLPWLLLMSSSNEAAIRDIQGRKPVYRLAGAIPVYIALAYLVSNVSGWEAFFTGAAVYAVYDFTVYVAFDKYPLWIACADMIWGVVLFTIVSLLLKKLKL